MGKIFKKFVILYAFILIGCSSFPEIHYHDTMDVAGENAEELLSVIKHYKDNKDSLKMQAAQFLIDNMYIHYSLRSTGLDSIIYILSRHDTIVSKDTINMIWKGLNRKDSVYRVYDAQSLTADFIIDEIDKSFDTWQRSLWRNDVDFEMYCNYILPYRLKDEPLKSGWRDSLREKYSSLVKGVRNMDIAYGKIYSAIYENMKAKTDMPYLTDPVTMHHLFRGGCLQRAVYVGSVMRALGLPVTIDCIDHWANVSTSGHYWIALVHKDRIAMHSDKDSLAHTPNRIDASYYPLKNRIERDYAYDTTFVKRAAKVFRITYERQNHNIIDTRLPKEIVRQFYFPFRKDVSCEYGMKTCVNLRFPNCTSIGALCTFVTGKGWYPVSISPIRKNEVQFQYIGDSIIYIGAYYEGEKLKSIGYPFLVVNGQKKYLVPDYNIMQRVTVTRKYPLTGNFISDWSMMRGSKFEISNNPKSPKWKTISTINRTPIFRNIIKNDKYKYFRFLRYQNIEAERIPHIAEIQVFRDNKRIHAMAKGKNCENVELCIDGDLFTSAKGKNKTYSIVFDLGKKQSVDSILFVPKNDGNFIIPGDKYELFYYDNDWKSVGIKKSKGFELTFDNVPEGALLWLRDLTRGKEERIFTVENGTQKWW